MEHQSEGEDAATDKWWHQSPGTISYGNVTSSTNQIMWN